MPHKFNTSRRHKFAKKKYRVTNWCGYNESLRNRGDLTVWITGDARKHWAAPRRRSRGGQPRYSDLAITMCLTLGMVYRLPLRQTQGLIRSISKLMLLEISVPDFSTLSRRGRGLSLPARPKIKITDPVHLAIDSTGLKVFDEGEWLQSKYNVKAKRKRWRKLHLGLNLVTGDIVCSDLTLDDVGDPTVLPDLLNQIGTPVSRFIADGAYDGAPTSDLLKARFGEAVAKSLFLHRRTPFQARNPSVFPHFETDILLKFKLMAAWPGNLAVATISPEMHLHLARSGAGTVRFLQPGFRPIPGTKLETWVSCT